MGKYIVFRADLTEEEGAENRLLAHTGMLTDILAEHFDSSNRPIPQPGYRFPEFHRIEKFADPKFPAANTHSRVGDWEVVRVQTYSEDVPSSDFETIVVCYCRFAPVNTPLEPMPQIQVAPQLQKTQV
jgi:hypothetical protein